MTSTFRDGSFGRLTSPGQLSTTSSVNELGKIDNSVSLGQLLMKKPPQRLGQTGQAGNAAVIDLQHVDIGILPTGERQ